MALTKIGVSSIKDTFKTTISGSARGELSSSVHLRQVATTISGSLGANAAVIRSLDRTTISGSIPQALATNSSPTFAAGTITGDLSVGGTLTAQEVHTEFESASILFTSGSTRFGDDTTDTHRVTGSMDISGSLKIPHGDLIIQDDIDLQGNIDVNGTTNLDVVDIDGAVTQDGGHFVINEAGADYDFRVESDGNENALRVDGQQGFIGMGASQPGFVNGNDHRGGNTQTTSGAGGLLHLEGLVPRIILDDTGDNPQFGIEAQDYFSIFSIENGSTAESTRIRINNVGDVGIGTTAVDPHGYGGTTLTVQTSGSTGDLGNISIAHKTNNSDGDGLGDLIFSNIGSSGSEKRAVIIRGLIDGATANNAGGRLQISTKQNNSTSFNTAVLITNEGSIQNGDTTGFASLYPAANNSNFVSYGFVGDQNTGMFRASADTLVFGTGGNERVRIASDGNVGIGTDSLGDAKLTIDGAQSNDVVLKIIQGIAKDALFVDMNANDNAISVSSDATTARGLSVAMDSLTTGNIANFQSNSSDNSSRFLVRILNDNPSATGAIGLYLQNDAAGGAELINGYSDARHFLQRLRAGNSSYDSAIFMSEANRTANSNYFFYKGQSDADGTPDLEFSVTGVGEVQGDSAYATPTSDYAEYFESKDGTAIPVGTTVKLDGEKIVSCSVGDTPIGVIRPNGTSSVIGNNAWNRWKGKYLKDSYGAYIYEEYSATTWEEGDDKKYYHTDRIPSSVTVPSDAVVTSTETDGSKLMRKKLNPDWDESKTYVSREERDEWNIVGLMGQIEMTKGQPTGSQWIKMKDISDTVELWFVK